MQTLTQALELLEAMDHKNYCGPIATGSYKNLRQLLERRTSIERTIGIDAARDTRVFSRIEELFTRALDRIIYGVQPAFVYLWDRENGKENKPYGLRRIPVRFHLRHNNTISIDPDEPDEFIKSTETVYRRPYMWQYSIAQENNPNRYTEILTDDPVMHVEFFVSNSQSPAYAPNTPDSKKAVLTKLKNHMKNLGYQFLGCKAKGSKPIAVFIQGPTFQSALARVVGTKIAGEILRSDDMKKIQNLVIMLCRVGWKPRIQENLMIHNFNPVHYPDPKLDGIVGGSNKELSKHIRHVHMLDPEAKVIAISLLMEEVHDKGLWLLDQKENFVAEKPKLGEWGRRLDLSRFLIHDIDSLALSTSRGERFHAKDDQITETTRNTHQGIQFRIGCNIKQLWVYCFTPPEQEILLDKVFIPEVIRASKLGGKFRGLNNLDRLISMGVTVDNIKSHEIRARLKTWILSASLNAPIEGMYVLAVVDPELTDFEIRVPLKAKLNGYKIGDIIDGGRNPMLPPGNGIQRFVIVGFTDGNYCQVSAHPWITIMGGDSDGDLIFITKVFVTLFPNKVWDQTLMSELEPVKGKRKGVRSEQERLNQAVIVTSQAIGIYDFAARQAWEINRLDKEARLSLGSGIQTEIMIAKHMVERKIGIKDLKAYRPPRLDGTDIYYATGVVRNAVNESKQKLLSVTHGKPYHRLFVKAWEQIEQKLPIKHLDIGLLKGLADKIPEDGLMTREEYLDLRKKGRNVAIYTRDQFRLIWKDGLDELEYQMLADKLSIWIELQALTSAEKGMTQEPPSQEKKTLSRAYAKAKREGDRQEMEKLEAQLTALPKDDWLARAMKDPTYKAPSLKKRYRAAREYLTLQIGGLCNWRLICRLSVPGWENLVKLATPTT